MGMLREQYHQILPAAVEIGGKKIRICESLSLAEEDLPDGQKQNEYIQVPGEVFDVVKIVFEFFFAVVKILSVSVIDLRPARETGTD